MNGGLSQVDSFDPEADARQVPRPAAARRHGGHRAQDRLADEVAVRVHALRQERPRGERAVPARRRVRRRHLRDPVDAHRHPESRAVDADDEHRPHPGRASVDRLVAHLRAGHRQQEPARLRGALPRRADHGGPAAVEQRVPAGHAPGHLHPEQGRAAGSDRRQGLRPEEAGLVHPQQGVHAARAAARARPARDARQAAARIGAARPATRSGHRLDGNGLPDADRGAGRVRHPQGEQGDAGAVRARAARRAAA